jgi:carbonic anhydrase
VLWLGKNDETSSRSCGYTYSRHHDGEGISSRRRPPAEGVAQVSAAEAIQQLLAGNSRYVEGKAVCPNPAQRPSAATQHPIAAILSCSDSRVPPEIVFDQGVGSLFVVRAAGNTYDELGLQSLEYAIKSLGAKLIVVLGHDNCGAVSAAVKSFPKPGAGVMVENIYPAVKKTRSMPGDPVSNAVSENAILVAERLRGAPQFRELIKTKEIQIIPARYNLKTGKIQILPMPRG